MKLSRRDRWTLFWFSFAILAGLALMTTFARFGQLHEHFLEANFETVHGTRTLLKAQGYLGQARLLLSAHIDQHDGLGATVVGETVHLVETAMQYAEESNNPNVIERGGAAESVIKRMDTVRWQLFTLERGGGAFSQRIQGVILALNTLEELLATAEVERWAETSRINTELDQRIGQLGVLIAGIILCFILIMGWLGTTLLRMRRAESALGAAHEQIKGLQQTTLEAAAMGICYVEGGGQTPRKLVAANQVMHELFGYAPGEMIGLPVSDLHPSGGYYEEQSPEVVQALERGALVRREVEMKRKDGSLFWCSISGKNVRFPPTGTESEAPLSSVSVWMLDDITAHKEAQRALTEARKRAEAASQAKSDFLANMSHEIRTPFSGVLGMIEFLLKTQLDDVQRRHVVLAQESLRQLLSIVNDVLDFSKIEAGKLELSMIPFSLERLIGLSGEMHRQEAERKGLEFCVNFMSPLSMPLVGDPVRLRQIIDNLCSNAVKFTHEGHVHLNIHVQPLTDDSARLRVTVSDTGIGIADTQKSMVFDKFTQADPSTARLYGGTGLGLAISRHLVQLMGGGLGVDSAPGQGSRFWFEVVLPVSGVSSDEGILDEEILSQALLGRRVLVVDDNEINRNIMQDILTQYGCVTSSAESGFKALLLTHDERFDFILMDCQMPEMDGFETTRRLRRIELEKNAPRQTIIAVTALASEEGRRQARASGMDDFLGKPVTSEQLLSCLAGWAGDGPGMGREWGRSDHEAGGEDVDANIEGGGCAYPRSTPLRLEGSHILLVEDNPTLVEIMLALLEDEGADVSIVGEQSRALERFAPGRFDAIVLDFHLAEGSGPELAREIRRLEKEDKEGGGGHAARVAFQPVFILGLTGNVMEGAYSQGREAGMDEVLFKPVPADDLMQILGEGLRARQKKLLA